MSPVGALAVLPERCFPRVSGDEPIIEATNGLIAMFSPREWG